MFEFHGWATIMVAYNEDSEDEHHLRAVVEALTLQIAKMRWSTNVANLCYINGSPQLNVSGLTNHRASEAAELFELYQHIAETAPGSYGLLYVHDDEGADTSLRNEFEVWVLRRGQFAHTRDSYLSPIVPTIEDAS